MQVFEFHFNPPRKEKIASGQEDVIFDTFCFEPKNVYEKRLGGLYMAGLLKNVLPQSARFLEILAEKIKDKYYKTASSTPEKSLRESLRIANEHLEKIAKEGDVSWLGNISFNVVSLKNHELNFTRIGDFKTLLIRKGQIIDIDQGLKFNEIEPYPLKVFGSIVSGKLAEDDIILVLSGNIYQAFLKENLLNDIARKSASETGRMEIKKFGNVLNGKKEQLAKISGICLLIVLSKEEAAKGRETIAENIPLKIFSFKKAFNPLFKAIRKIRISKLKSDKLKISWPRISSPFKQGPAKVKKENKALPASALTGLSRFRISEDLKKKLTLILVLALILTAGFFIFEKKTEQNAKIYQSQIEQIKKKIELADSHFILSEYNPLDESNAKALYLEAWNEISPLTNISLRMPKGINSQALELKNAVLEKLYQLNKLEEISEPELVFEFKARDFIPQKLLYSNNKIYFFTADEENVFELNPQEKQGRTIETDQKISQASLLADSIMLFSQPDRITFLQEGELKETVNLQQLSPETELSDLSPYRSNLYFLDKKNNAIVKYPAISESNWGNPESWLAPETKTATDFRSMTVDGSIWVLTEKNSIDRYHASQFQETIVLEIFPEPKNFLKIFTALEFPHLYILEAEQKRIVILDKAGQLVKQYQSEKFDNLLDFSLSEDGNTIWLLNDLKVYKIAI
ncbi:MAG: hypothetical protein Q8P74_01255 [bacterium]|nr:hypothetical protein [bacterium]